MSKVRIIVNDRDRPGNVSSIQLSKERTELNTGNSN